MGKIEGGEALNIIADRVLFSGDLRVLDTDTTPVLKDKICKVCEGIATASGGNVKVRFLGSFPAVVNDEVCSDIIRKSAGKVLGDSKVVEIKKPTLGNDDIAYFLNEVPGCFFIIGADAPAGKDNFPHHHPRFDIGEDVLWVGPAVLAQVAFDITV